MSFLKPKKPQKAPDPASAPKPVTYTGDDLDVDPLGQPSSLVGGSSVGRLKRKSSVTKRSLIG